MGSAEIGAGQALGRGAAGSEPEAAAPRVFTDSHAHLDLVAERLGEAALAEVLAAYGGREAADGPFVVDIGTEPGDLGGRVRRLGLRPCLRFAAGLWPGRAAFGDPGRSLAALEADLEAGLCSALGECGLDYHHMEAEPRVQRSLFEAQALMAAERGMTLVVHSRDAFLDSLSVVAELAGAVPVVIHCFGYGPAEAERFLAAGCLLSFAGNLGYKSAEGQREALRLTPLDRLLFETDAPYMNPAPRRGRPSTPLDIERTVETAADLLGMDVAALGRAAGANAARVFPERAPRP